MPKSKKPTKKQMSQYDAFQKHVAALQQAGADDVAQITKDKDIEIAELREALEESKSASEFWEARYVALLDSYDSLRERAN
jgi:hypothetical protein